MIIIETFARGATDPRATHVASCGMITGIGCPTLVRFSSATADSGRLCLTLP